MRSVMGQGTTHCNVSAVIMVNAQNFSNSNTLSFVLVSEIIMLLILLPIARHLGTPDKVMAPPTGAAG